MSKIDCERFIRGAKEIDRERNIITRVLTSVGSLLNQKSVITSHRGKFLEILLKIPIENFSFVVVYTKKALSCRILDGHGKDNLWWGSVNYADAIPARVVPIVYKNLSTIVERIDEAFPEAGIYSHFEFFSGQTGA